MLASSFDVLTLNGAKAPGTVNVPLAIPAIPALDGLTLFLQAPVLGGVNPIDVSNAFSIGLGN
jgi:hypothetical protein